MTIITNACKTIFGDTQKVCLAVHYPEQTFAVKLLLRENGSKRVLKSKFEWATYAEHARNFKAWRSGGWEPFMMLAVMDGEGYSSENMKETWAVAIDLDGDVDIAAWELSPFKPSLAIGTSDGRYHLVWILKKPIDRAGAHAFLTALAARCNADRTFANVTQAIRLPGFINGKNGNEVELLDWSDGNRSYDLDDLKLAFDFKLVCQYLCSRQPRFTPGLIISRRDVPKDNVIDDAKSALQFIPSDDYDTWYRVGMALSSLGQQGYDLWVDWSKSSKKFASAEMPSKWKSFGNVQSITMASVFALAAGNGWRNPGFRKKSDNHDSGLQFTERSIGRLLAAKMYGEYAAIASEGRSRHAYLLLHWDGEKYTVLSDIERRRTIEDFVRQVKEENVKYEKFVQFLTFKSSNNRALDDMNDHLCECLFEDSAACVTSSYPYLPVENGVLNLLMRQLVPAFLRPLSMVSGCVRYDPTAKAPLYLQTLNEIFEGDQSMIQTINRLFGYILLGRPNEHIMPVFYGPTGRNGKTLTAQAARQVFGEYAHAMAASAILEKSHVNDGPTPAVAVLFRKRLAIISEPGEKHPLDSGFIKLMTGGEEITARAPHGQLFEFMPEFTPLLITNTFPPIREDNHAMWARLKIVPFTRTFSDDEKDVERIERLKVEKSGILNLFLDGIEDYRAHGLNLPDKIKSAVVEQRKEMDPYEAWREECTQVVDKSTATSLQDLAASYDAWAQFNRQFRRLSKKDLSRKLVEHNYEKFDKRHCPNFRGISLKENLAS